MLFKNLTLLALPAAAVAQQMNLTAALASNPNLSNLTTYLGAYPSFVEQLSSMTDITLLAPDNNAFSKLLNSAVGQSFQANDTSLVTAFFSYHVLQGVYYASNITSNASFIPTALMPGTNYTSLQPGAVVEGMMNGDKTQFVSGLLTQSTVTQADNNFTGGVYHVIDTFLTIPQNVSTTLVAVNETAAAGALMAANMASQMTMGNVTAFIPNNVAFQAIGNLVTSLSMQDLGMTLGYHLVPNQVLYSTNLTTNMTLMSSTNMSLTITNVDGTTFVNNAKVVLPDVLVQEGVVHIIDEVLNPMNTTAVSNPSATEVAYASATSGSMVPFTSGIPAPSSVPATPRSSASMSATSGSGGASSSTRSAMAVPMQTGAVAIAALMGGAAAVLNM